LRRFQADAQGIGRYQIAAPPFDGQGSPLEPQL
jgi:hypothetical protein